MNTSIERCLAVVISISFLVGMVPSALFAATETMTLTKPAKATYYVGEDISFIFNRGTTTGTVRGELQADNGGLFSNGTVEGSCSATVSEIYPITIASNANRKAFCYRATNSGTETISLTLEGTGEVLTYEVTIIELPPLQYNNNGEVSICQYVGLADATYVTKSVAVDTSGTLAENQSGTGDDVLRNIIPPFEYLTNTFEVRQYAGRNWTIENRALYNNNCARIDVVIEGCTNERALNFNPIAVVDDGSCEYDIICDPGFILDDALTCVPDIPQVCERGLNLIKNGSFEDPIADENTLGDGQWEVFTEIPYWSATASIEVWRNMFGGAKEGFQNIELDMYPRTTLSQTIATERGGVYELRFSFSPRPETGLEDNITRVYINGIAAVTAESDGLGNPTNSWDLYSQQFIAMSERTDIAFADIGIANGLGSLLDDVIVCQVGDPVLGCTNQNASNYNTDATLDDGSCLIEEDVYLIEGYVWHDDNRNMSWEGVTNPVQNTERPLTGFTVVATSDIKTISTTTDSTGFYALAVPAGTWTVTVLTPDRWRIVTAATYTVTVGKEDGTVGVLGAFINKLIPVAQAAVLGRVGPFNFGLDQFSGGSNSNTSPGVPVIEIVSPTPQVLGEQVSRIPVGAPHTGGGQQSMIIVGSFLALPKKPSRGF